MPRLASNPRPRARGGLTTFSVSRCSVRKKAQLIKKSLSHTRGQVACGQVALTPTQACTKWPNGTAFFCDASAHFGQGYCKKRHIKTLPVAKALLGSMALGDTR